MFSNIWLSHFPIILCVMMITGYMGESDIYMTPSPEDLARFGITTEPPGWQTERLLEDTYKKDAYISFVQRKELSEKLKVRGDRIKYWFEQRREQDRMQGIEPVAWPGRAGTLKYKGQNINSIKVTTPWIERARAARRCFVASHKWTGSPTPLSLKRPWD